MSFRPTSRALLRGRATVRAALAAVAVTGLLAAGTGTAVASSPPAPPEGGAADVAVEADAGIDPRDTTARTDDKSTGVPTAWWTYTNVTVATISSLLSSNNARLTDIEVYDAAAGRYSVVMVRNSGAYAVPGWWWYVGQTFTQVGQLLSNNNGRLLDIERYVVNGAVRYTVVMVSNTGTTARSWGWLVGATSTQVNNLVASGQRLIHFESYGSGAGLRYIVISVANSGADSKAWQYWYGQSFASVATRVSSFGGRLVSLFRQADGTYLIVLVKNSGTDAFYWRYHAGLSSASQVLSIANQFGARVVDLETTVVSGVRSYSAVMIDNSNAATGRIRGVFGNSLVASNGLPRGNWGAYVKRIGSSVSTSLQSGLPFEPASAIKAVHNLAVMSRVQAGTDSLGSSFTYYNYPSSTQPVPGNACPNPAEETTANDVFTTLDNGRGLMMTNSDNRTTRGITLRYGLAAIQSRASSAGMASTSIQQPLIGCGWKNNVRNLTTLQDLGILYEGVQNGSLLNTTNRNTFYAPMNGGTFGTSGTEGAIRTVVQQEGTSLGKTTAQVNDFISRMEWRFKPGGYGIGCPNAFSSCTSGSITITTMGGRLTLPIKASATTYSSRMYVFGRFIDQVNTGCSGCVTTTTVSNTASAVDRELFREVIRSALSTF